VVLFACGLPGGLAEKKSGRLNPFQRGSLFFIASGGSCQSIPGLIAAAVLIMAALNTNFRREVLLLFIV